MMCDVVLCVCMCVIVFAHGGCVLFFMNIMNDVAVFFLHEYCISCLMFYGSVFIALNSDVREIYSGADGVCVCA